MNEFTGSDLREHAVEMLGENGASEIGAAFTAAGLS